MSRGRIIEKTISTSRKFSKLSSDSARLLFLLIIPHTDDYGRLEADALLIKSIVMPTSVATLDDVKGYMTELEKVGLIRTYEIENDGDKDLFLEVTKFDEFQTFRVDRKRQAKHPLPPWDANKPVGSTNDIPVGENRQRKEGRKLSKGSKGRKEVYTPTEPKTDTDEKEVDVYDDERFIFFWNEYPKKTGKGDAWKSWGKLKPSNDLARKIVISVREHKAKHKDWNREGGKYIPNPATFLNQRRFDDEVNVGIGSASSGKFDNVGKKT